MGGRGNEVPYGSAKDSQKSQSRNKRELLRVRSSITFELATLFIKAIERPWRLLWLPISIIRLAIISFRRSPNERDAIKFSENSLADSSRRECVVFFPTNGVGLGHFTRTLAVARKMKKAKPDLEIVFFTTMPALHILKNEGFPAYHVPGRKMFEDMGSNVWNSIADDLLTSVFSIHRPKAFIFDGSYPYRGMLNAIKDQGNMWKVWIKRGSLKKENVSIPLDSFGHFDSIVRPGDIVEEEDLDVVPKSVVVDTDPVILLDTEELLPREYLRRRLGIPDQDLVAYLQLGAGRINNIESDIAIAIEELRKRDIWAVIGESIIGSRAIIPSTEKIRVLRDYPNSRYYNSFDFSIQAGGYNSFHESIRYSLPAIVIPNTKTGADDQMARSLEAEKAGCMIVIREVSTKTMGEAISKISEKEERGKMWDAAAELHRPNGADQISRFILEKWRIN